MGVDCPCSEGIHRLTFASGTLEWVIGVLPCLPLWVYREYRPALQPKFVAELAFRCCWLAHCHLPDGSCFTCAPFPSTSCPVPDQPYLFLAASTPWMPSQCCSACSHAGSQCPHNSAEGKLLHGWNRWWLHHLVKNRGHLYAGKDITYLQHFSQCNCFSHINLKLQFRHMLLGCLSGAQTFRHFSNLIRNQVMVAVPP